MFSQVIANFTYPMAVFDHIGVLIMANQRLIQKVNLNPSDISEGRVDFLSRIKNDGSAVVFCFLPAIVRNTAMKQPLYQSSMNFAGFFMSVLASPFLLTVIYSGTKSIYLCIIFHAAKNALWEVFTFDTRVLTVCFTLLYAIIIFIAFEAVHRNSIKKVVKL
jgi:hypothetical protein